MHVQTAMRWLVMATIFGGLPAAAQHLKAYESFRFNPDPDLEVAHYNNPEVVAWYREAESFNGKGDAAEQFAACRSILASDAASDEVKRWASFRIVDLYFATARGPQAQQEAKDWLARNPEHPMAQHLRFHLMKRMTDSNPDYGVERAMSMLNEMLSVEEPANRLTVEACYMYARFVRSDERMRESLEFLELARILAKEMVAVEFAIDPDKSTVENILDYKVHKHQVEWGTNMLEGRIKDMMDRLQTSTWQFRLRRQGIEDPDQIWREATAAAEVRRAALGESAEAD